MYADAKSNDKHGFSFQGNTVLHVAKRKSSEQVERVILETTAGQKLLEEKNLVCTITCEILV